MEAKCGARNFKPPDGIGLTVPHKWLAVFAYIVNIGWQLEMEMPHDSCGLVQRFNVCH